MESMLSVGLQGVQTGVASARNAAQDIVTATTTGTEIASGNSASRDAVTGDVTADIATAVVELKMSEHQVQASAAVIKSADEMMGTLIDIKA